MASLNLNLDGVGKGILAEVAFISGWETIREHIAALSTTLIYVCRADSFKKKSEDEAFVLKEIVILNYQPRLGLVNQNYETHIDYSCTPCSSPAGAGEDSNSEERADSFLFWH